MRRKREYGIINMLKTISKHAWRQSKHHFYDGAFLIACYHHKRPKRLKQIKQRRYLFEETNQKRKKKEGKFNYGKLLYMGFLCAVMLGCFALPAFAASDTPTIWEKATEKYPYRCK